MASGVSEGGVNAEGFMEKMPTIGDRRCGPSVGD